MVTDGGYVVRHDESDGAFQPFEESGTAGQLSEVAGGTDVSTETVTIEATGR